MATRGILRISFSAERVAIGSGAACFENFCVVLCDAVLKTGAVVRWRSFVFWRETVLKLSDFLEKNLVTGQRYPV